MPEGQYYKKLIEFLNNNRAKRGEKTSHFSMGTPVGSYYLSGAKRDRLNRLVARALNEGAVLSILEKHRSQGPILFDIDVKYKNNDENRVYTEENIKKTVEVYNKYIKKYLKVDTIECFITEKCSPTKVGNNEFKDGFHGEYPYICASAEMQYLIRSRVVNEFKENDYYNNLNYQNNYDDIFDQAIVHDNGWFLYGCCKPKRDPYLLTNIYDANLNLISKNTLKNDVLVELLSIRNFSKDDITDFNDNYSDEMFQKDFNELNLKKNNKNLVKKRSREYSEEDIEYAQKLVKLLSVDRADNYQSWIEVGWALYNIDDLLIDNFIEFSQISSQFKYGECEKLWDKMRNQGTRGVGLGSLIKWAENDNPEEFLKLRDEAESNIIRKSISGASGDVARSFYHINKGKFICASIKHSLWYEFKSHRWKPIDSGTTIFKMLNDDYPAKYKKVADYYYFRSLQLEGDEKKLFEIKREASLKTAEKLTTVKFKKEVIDELKHRYYDEDFFNKLDENRYLLCCKNGVYDFKNEIFREGYADDYVSLCTNVDYQVFSKEDRRIKEINTFFNEIQPEDDMSDYVLDYFSTCLVGQSPDELFHIWTGSGGNGKSLSIGLFQSIIGDYASTIGITLLTNKRAASNAASPEMAQTKGKRFVVFQEPENDDKIHVGHMKELTGNDKISARALFKEPVEFYPQFKTILTCNKLPFIPSNDGGTWRRLRVTPFEMKFVSNPKEPNERKKDTKLKEKMEDWREPFLFLLINRYVTRYKKLGNIEPAKIKKFTDDYQRQSDIYYEYISEHLELTGNSKDKINLTNMYNDFRMWYKEAHTERKLPSRGDLKDNIEEKLGKMKTNGWRGVRFAIANDDSDNDSECSEEEKNKYLTK